MPFEYKAQIFDQQGALIKELYSGDTWNGTDLNDKLVPTGLYLIKDVKGNFVTLTVLRSPNPFKSRTFFTGILTKKVVDKTAFNLYCE